MITGANNYVERSISFHARSATWPDLGRCRPVKGPLSSSEVDRNPFSISRGGQGIVRVGASARFASAALRNNSDHLGVTLGHNLPTDAEFESNPV